jgi:hypothetical protein
MMPLPSAATTAWWHLHVVDTALSTIQSSPANKMAFLLQECSAVLPAASLYHCKQQCRLCYRCV